MMNKRPVALLAVLLLTGCANHPVDCAIGIPWGDCREGTAGYNNGGGQQTRATEIKRESADISAQTKVIGDQCKSDLTDPALDPIRSKVELSRDSWDSAPPFDIAANDTFPSAAERPVIARWAEIRDNCLKRERAVNFVPPGANAMQTAFVQQRRAFYSEAEAKVGELILALYGQKLTYGEFAKKRYEITRDASDAELSYRQSALDRDAQLAVQAQQAAQARFANAVAAWGVYMQAVNARQPQTVHLDGTITVIH